MIYVVTKTRINKSQLARWNREQGPKRGKITLQTKRQELESAISKFAKTLPGVNYEVNVPVVYVDAFALDEEEKQEYSQEEIKVFNYEADTLTRFLA